MAGKYGSKDIALSLDDAPGGTPRPITNHLLEISGIKIESMVELSDAFGDTWEESTPSGKKKMPDISLGGLWDTTPTTGPHAVMGVPDSDPNGGTRTLVFTAGDSKTCTVEGLLISYEVIPSNSKLTRFMGVFRPSGAAVWA